MHAIISAVGWVIAIVPPATLFVIALVTKEPLETLFLLAFGGFIFGAMVRETVRFSHRQSQQWKHRGDIDL